jgi:hypothetical protein
VRAETDRSPAATGGVIAYGKVAEAWSSKGKAATA